MRYKTPRLQLDTTQKFGRLTPISFDKMVKLKSKWFFKCDCGVVISLVANEVMSGHTSSCGCLRKEVTSKLKLSHGFAHGSKIDKDFYFKWANMIQRCTNIKVAGYKNYGGRGITICERWFKFENFRDLLFDGKFH